MMKPDEAKKAIDQLVSLAPKQWQRPHPSECPYCEYDRGFPETAGGGWIYMGNNGPIGSCPFCNPSGEHPRR